jgi:hypothetical protein
MKWLCLAATLCMVLGCRTRPDEGETDLAVAEDMAEFLCNGQRCQPHQSCAFPGCDDQLSLCELDASDGGCPRFYELTECRWRPGTGCTRAAGPYCVDTVEECATGEYACWWLYEPNQPICCNGRPFPDCL